MAAVTPIFDGYDTFRTIEAWVVEPDDFEERLKRLRFACDNRPEVLEVLKYVFEDEERFKFTNLASQWPKKDGLLPPNGDVKELYFPDFVHHASYWVDSVAASNKVSSCIGHLEWTDVEDLKLLLDIIHGKNPFNDLLNEKLYGALRGKASS